MLRILVVEDDTEKNRRVLRLLSEMREVASDFLDNARDAMSAKKFLRERQYDLVILDIAIPGRADTDPTPFGGVELLQEVLERDIYLKPVHIVGLTAFDEIFEVAGAKFGEDLWSVLKYDPGSTEWEAKLRKKIRYIALSKTGELVRPEYDVTLCVLTALKDPELDAVLRLPWNWSEMDRPSDCTIYHTGEYSVDGRRQKVVAANSPRMGMTSAASLAMKMIIQYRPRYIAMVGILAGVEGKCNLGDVVAADPSWDYGSGKYYVKDGQSLFAPFPYQIGLDSFLRANLSRLADDNSLLSGIRDAWPGLKPDTVLKLRVAPVACGAAVLSDKRILEDKIREQNLKVVGIDMESYGLMGAADESPLPATKAFCLKSVCDFANPNKDDNWQAYASYTSASILRAFCERYLG
jgi:nucleoside phosphorylase/CheY-like chemotaxis protein